MFGTVLIANRGEIACRIIRTARRMGIRTVAVFSEADRGALHVAMADEAVWIGQAPAADSYLRADRILEACRRTGAEAVHPGYGFLSERASFATALVEAGIVFIGPNARAIAAMGDKIESKKAALAAGVSTVPGFLGIVEGPDHAVAIARDIGFPVMIKASAGGGGKGMRVARNAGEVADGFARARSEAASSFGDDRVFIEKFIVAPRHIEIQTLGDRHGAVIHLGERECSVQRRNQKVVEEAPSPLLDAETRRRMGEQAVSLAKAVGYDSAGTVEFVVGPDRSFYFLEMNTRLQVEHPVTEMVTGLDLVELMIRVAAGERLPLRQEDVRLDGSAIETRIYAEDPTRDFLPSIGRLTTFRPPTAVEDGPVRVRLDTGVAEGGEIPIFYDPMVAKLVTHAPTRAAATDAQARALDAFAIGGIRHNVPFLSALMAHPRWREARLSTAFIAEEFPDGFVETPPAGAPARRIAAVAAAMDHGLNERKRGISGQLRPGVVRFERDRVVLLGRERHDLTVENGEGGPTVAFPDGERIAVSSRWRPGEPVWTGRVGNATVAIGVRPVINGWVLSHAGTAVGARVFTRREAALAALMPESVPSDGGKAVLCPMPGLVKSIAVVPGQAVKVGEALAVVEAMKMENVLRAERDGTVAAVLAREGESLAVDAVILEFA